MEFAPAVFAADARPVRRGGVAASFGARPKTAFVSAAAPAAFQFAAPPQNGAGKDNHNLHQGEPDVFF